MSVLSEKPIKAIRKDRYCMGCGCKQLKGSPMVRIASVYDGELYNTYLCPPCYELWSDREWYRKTFGDDGWNCGDFLEAANESGFSTTAELVQHLKDKKEI